MKLWGGRFETGPSEVFERFSGSLDFDRRLLECDCTGSKAFVRALGRVGILTSEEVAALEKAYDAVRAKRPGLRASSRAPPTKTSTRW